MRLSSLCLRRLLSTALRRTLHVSILLLLALAPLVAPSPSVAVTIDWVQVGDSPNVADTPSNCFAANCGSVGDGYNISKYETTNAQYAEFLNAKAASDPLGLYHTNMGSDTSNGGITRSGSDGSYTYSVKSGFANKPVTYVSFYDALRFANWLNNGQGAGDTETGAYTLLGGTPTPSNGTTVTRNPGAIAFLTSENEWYKAAYFDNTSYFDYPVQTNTQTVCTPVSGTPNRANCNNAVGAVTEVGAYEASASHYGTFDQGGNVWEWNEQLVGGSQRGQRGGAFYDDPVNLGAAYPNGGDPEVEYVGVGFRVASLVPEPGTGLLVMTGVLGLAWRRRGA
jgi:formylglycine-generating enzyme required for sulfatase activity